MPKERSSTFNFSKLAEWIAILSGVVTIVTLPIVIYQLFDIKKAKYDRSTQLLGIFDQEFYSGANLDVRHAIKRKGPLLKEHGGPITDEQLEDYLDVFEVLSDAYDRHLIEKDMLYTYESYYFEETYQNKEVQEYLSEARKEDPDFYQGFEELAKRFLAEDHKPTRLE